MQLKDLFKPIEQLTDDELKDRLREIRHNRTVERPAAKAHAKRAESKGRVTRINKAQSLLSGLSAEELKQLLLEMEGGNG